MSFLNNASKSIGELALSPLAIQSFSSQFQTRRADNTINDVGLTKSSLDYTTWTMDNNLNNMWMHDATPFTDAFIIYDLGSTVSVTKIVAFPFNQTGYTTNTTTSRRIRGYTLTASNNVADLTDGNTNNVLTGEMSIDDTAKVITYAVNVRYIRLDVNTKWGSAVEDFVGLSKFRIVTNATIIAPSSTASGPAGGDLAGTFPNPIMANSGVTAGTYRGQAYTIDAKGRITAATANTYYQKVDFSASYGDLSTRTIAGAGVITLSNSNVVYSGQLTLGSGNTASSSAGVKYENTDWIGKYAGITKTVLRINTLSDGTDTYSLRAGFISLVTAESTNGIFFRYSSANNAGKWECVVVNSTTLVATDSGVTVAANTDYTLTVTVNAAGTSAVFNINGTDVATVTSGLPSTNAGRGSGPGIMILKSAGTNSRLVFADYIEYTLV